MVVPIPKYKDISYCVYGQVTPVKGMHTLCINCSMQIILYKNIVNIMLVNDQAHFFYAELRLQGGILLVLFPSPALDIGLVWFPGAKK